MSTENKMNIPWVHKDVKNYLEQASQSSSVVQMYYHPKDSSGFEHLLIITDNERDAEKIREKQWVTAARAEQNINIYTSSVSRTEYQLRKGYPLVHYCCHPSLLIYAGQGRETRFKNDLANRKLVKKYSTFQEAFFHDHDILISEANRFYQLKSTVSTYLTYLKVIEHDLDYLEYVYTGAKSRHENLHIRLKNLMPWIPVLKKLMVKKNEHAFYLIARLEDAVRAAECCDEIYIKTELYASIQHLENQLYQLIDHRFEELKSLLKSPRPVWVAVLPDNEIRTEDKNLESAVSVIRKMADPEEIFLFHKADSCENKVSTSLYYLLVIGNGIGNDRILQLQDAVYKKTGSRAKVIILSHSRIAVQESLFNYQQFMRQIMTGQNRIYTSDVLHPEIHWEEPYTVEYGDMDVYYIALQGYVSQYFSMRRNIGNDNRHGFISVFANCFTRALRIYLYGALHSYRPHHLNTFSIWKLCVYADPSMEKIEFLFSKLSSSFYRLIDQSLKYTDTVDHYPEEKLLIMDEIIEQIMDYIKNMIRDKGLENR
ncbi:hypothetical protein [Chryseobacterium sp.]|uniref:hypothetical protein n=1 Tax=Chryseobacterium sp. TaxID=1871047 RepID=UPI00289B09C0|nr:hypothetical protein [Chryseobacterium sp.]